MNLLKHMQGLTLKSRGAFDSWYIVRPGQEVLIEGRGIKLIKIYNTIGKLTILNFHGSGKITAHSWIQNIEMYIYFNLMLEEDAIKFAILHLEGVTHDWWHYGLITQNHQSI